MNEKELFENNCFPLAWCEDEEHFEQPMVQRKDMTTLLAELEDIQNRIDDISAREWHLAKLVKFYQNGFVADWYQQYRLILPPAVEDWLPRFGIAKIKWTIHYRWTVSTIFFAIMLKPSNLTIQELFAA